MPPSPKPIDATYTVATASFVVTFDRPLQPGPVTPGNWLFHTPTGGRKGLAPVNAAGSTVSGPTQLGVVLGPVNTCRYTPPPHDVQGVDGTPVKGFVDFPLTII